MKISKKVNIQLYFWVTSLLCKALRCILCILKAISFFSIQSYYIFKSSTTECLFDQLYNSERRTQHIPKKQLSHLDKCDQLHFSFRELNVRNFRRSQTYFNTSVTGIKEIIILLLKGKGKNQKEIKGILMTVLARFNQYEYGFNNKHNDT